MAFWCWLGQSLEREQPHAGSVGMRPPGPCEQPGTIPLVRGTFD